jgi:hypothetical protein
MPVTGISLAVTDSWRVVPTSAGDGEPWADALVTEWSVEGIAAASLREQLVRLQLTLSSRVGPDVTSLVWVPVPASGYCAAGLVAMNWPLGDSGIADPASALELFGAGAFIDDGDTVLDQRLWSGEVAAGPFAAVHRVRSTPSDDSEAVMESVDFLVFPAGSSEFVHLAFTAESIMAFDDMPAQTQALIETLELTVGGDA